MTIKEDAGKPGQASSDESIRKPGEEQGGPELSDQQLDKVSGGVIRRVRGGDDDLDDLEVER